MDNDLTLMHLMCAKICHDLAAPVSAVAMGLEMLQEKPVNSETDNNTKDIMAYSVQSVISKIEMFRCLTGFSGMPDKPTGQDIETVLKNYWVDGKIRLVFPKKNLDSLHGLPARLLAACLLTAGEGLPQGGMLTLRPDLSIEAQGVSAGLKEGALNALTGQSLLSQQTVRTIVPFFAATLAQKSGGKITVGSSQANQFQINFISKTVA